MNMKEMLYSSHRHLDRLISFLFTGIFTSFLIIAALLILNYVETLNLKVYLVSLAITLIFLVSTGFMRLVISRKIKRFIRFKEDQGLTERVLKLNEKLTLITEDERALEEVVRSLAIEGACIVLENPQGMSLKNTAGIFLEKSSLQVELEKFFQGDQKLNLDAKILPDIFPAEIYIPVVYKDFVCGIFLGHRVSHVKFEPDELPVLKLISSQLAQRWITSFVIKELSLELKALAQRSRESQRRNQGLQGITTSLFRSLEKEREKVALEINDGPMQLGLDLNRWLKYTEEECPTNPKIDNAIVHMRELVEELNFELRLIANGLRPSALSDLGLLTAVELMCKEIMLNELSLITIETVGISREERFKEEVELAAYRFLQEGIANAVKHSGSNKLKLHIEITDSKLELGVKDLGKGFDTNRIGNWLLTGNHFGIVGMKERIESLGGNLTIISEIHQGTILKATIPIL